MGMVQQQETWMSCKLISIPVERFFTCKQLLKRQKHVSVHRILTGDKKGFIKIIQSGRNPSVNQAMNQPQRRSQIFIQKIEGPALYMVGSTGCRIL